jgi:hypothetical protein
MICPLQSMRAIREVHSCEKEKCAWWNKELEQCCLAVIATDIDDLVKGQRTLFTREI